MGTFVAAHLCVYNNPAQTRQFLELMADHLYTAGVGSLSEIFDGDAPRTLGKIHALRVCVVRLSDNDAAIKRANILLSIANNLTFPYQRES